MAEDLRPWHAIELEALHGEHALRLVDVAVRHVHDGHITRAVETPEGDVGQDRLHVSVVDLEALADLWQVCGKGVLGVAGDDGANHVGLAQLGGAARHVVRLESVQHEAGLPRRPVYAPEEQALVAGKDLGVCEVEAPRLPRRLHAAGDVAVLLAPARVLPELPADVDAGPVGLPVSAGGVGRVGVELEQLLLLRHIALVRRKAVAERPWHLGEVEARETAAGAVPDPTVPRVGAVEAHGRGVGGHDALRLGAY
mmetsp:Transcript_77831/g.241887  ORF Transcript_77831/g.241887 Transcript_77831/m.241887 type:complete len:254 (+) Transcript_77831:1675-2436(+)